MKIIFAALLALAAIPAHAALQIRACTIGSAPPYVQTPTGPFTADLTGLAWVSASASGTKPFCKKLSVEANAFVQSSPDAGKTWVWVSVASALGSTVVSPPVTPPAPVAGVATISWSPSTTDVTGAKITIPVTYNIYRDGANVATNAVSPWKDTGVMSGSSHCWTASATDAGGTSVQSSPPVCLTIAAPPGANAPVAPSGVTAK